MNIISLSTFDRALAILGFGLTLVGLGLTLWQVHKTQAAAQAAKKAADDAVAVVRGLEAVTKMHDISGRSRELLRLLRNKTLEPATISAFELRDTVARYRKDSHARLAIAPAEWQKAVEDVRVVHEALETITGVKRFTAAERGALIIEVARLHTFFTGLAAQA